MTERLAVAPIEWLPAQEGLATNTRSSRDFFTAMRILDNVDPRYRDDASLKISRTLVQAGGAPLFPPGYFLDVARGRNFSLRNALYEGTSMLQAEMGDIPGAMQTAEQTHNFPWFSIDLAKVVARQGGNAQVIFDTLHAELTIRAMDIDGIRRTGEALEAQRELGLIAPKSLIDRFKPRTERNGDDDNHPDTYNLELAEAYATAGYPDDALQIWSLARDNGYHHRAEVLSIIALSQAKNGIDPREIGELTSQLTEAIKPEKSYHPACVQADIYARLGKAYALAELDPTPLINRGLEKAAQEHSNLQADAYTAVAETQVKIGANARPAIALALEAADAMVKPGEEDASGFGGQIQLNNWEEIFRVQLAGGYYDDARQVLTRMDRYPHPDIKVNKATLLAELAVAEAKTDLVF